MSSNGLHSVSRIRFVGDKAIQDGNTNRILLNDKVTITKAGDSDAEGLTIKGKTADGNNADLLSVFHNATGHDAINYKGKQDAPTNLATVGYVDDKVGSGGGSSFTPGDQVAKTNGEATVVGGFWISNGALYCKVN
jgi:hypothetical protein